MARSFGNIGEAFVQLSVETSKLNAQFREAQRTSKRSADRMARSVESVDQRLGRAAASAATFGRALAALGTGAVVVSLANLVRGMIQTGDEIAKTADKVGVGIEALQELRFAAERSGVGARSLDSSLERFSRRIGEAAQGGGELVKTLDQYGIAVRDANGNTRDNVDILGDLADAVAGAASEQEKLRIIFDAFGREGGGFINLLKNGSEGMDQLRERARSLGNIMSTETARAAEEAQDAITDLTQVSQSLGQVFARNVIPFITEFIAKIERLVLSEDNLSVKALEQEYADAVREANRFRKELEAAENGFNPAGTARINDLKKAIQNADKEAVRLAKTIEGITGRRESRRDNDGDPDGGPDTQTFDQQAKINKTIDALTRQRDVTGLATHAQVALAETLDRLGIEYGVTAGKVDVFNDKLERVAELSEAIARAESTKAPPALPFARPEVQGPNLPTPEEEAAARLRQREETRRITDDLEQQRAAEQGRRALAELNAELQQAEAFGDAFGQTIADGFADAILGAESFQDALEGVLRTLARLVLEQAVLQPLAAGISGGIQGLFPAAGGGAAAAAGGAIVSGNRISGGRPGIITRRSFTRFASGGILHGEAGAEVVVPLSQSRLGPFLNAMNGGGSGGGDTTIQVIDQRGANAPPIETTESNDGGQRVIRTIVRSELNQTIGLGGADATMGERFGATARPRRLRG